MILLFQSALGCIGDLFRGLSDGKIISQFSVESFTQALVISFQLDPLKLKLIAMNL